MHIALDTTPLTSEHELRGIGWYTRHLLHALEKYAKEHSITTFQKNQKIGSDIDIVHYVTFDPFFLTFPAKLQHKTVVTIHDLTPVVFMKEFNPGIRGKLRWHFQKSRVKKAHAIITDSYASKKDIISFIQVDADKVHVIPLAAGEEFREITDKDTLAMIQEEYDLQEKFILYVGDINYNKNIPTLLKIFSLIQAKEKNISLVLVGESFLGSTTEAKNIDRLINELNINQAVKRFGFVPTADLMALYSLATAYIQPSLYEGFGLPVLEALQCGCPVISSHSSSLREVGGNVVKYANPEKIEMFAHEVEEILHWPSHLRQENIRKGKEHAAKFTWEKTAAQTLAVYQHLHQN